LKDVYVLPVKASYLWTHIPESCRGCLGSDLYNAAVSFVKCLQKPTLSGKCNTVTVLGAGDLWSSSFIVDQK